MLLRAEGVVKTVSSSRNGLQELEVRVGLPEQPQETRLAFNYTALNGPVEVGDRVLLNTVAVELGLGTGGYDFVVGVMGRALQADMPGHLLKLRYTPLQTPVLAVEAPESPFHNTLQPFRGLEGTPVVCCGLHSQLGPVCFAAHWALQERGTPPRIAYIMTDSAALALPLSRLVAQLQEEGLLQATITCGQAFGGDYEAINLYSALQAAKWVVGADLIVVGQGPGNAGTQTTLGFSGIDQGVALNAVAAMQGTAICVARLSFAEDRARHRGLSEQTLVVLERVALAQALLPLPRLPQQLRQQVWQALEGRGISQRHTLVELETEPLYPLILPKGWRSMGRSPQEDPWFFHSALAAGLLAAQKMGG